MRKDAAKINEIVERSKRLVKSPTPKRVKVINGELIETDEYNPPNKKG